jgi:hypothetical protein
VEQSLHEVEGLIKLEGRLSEVLHDGTPPANPAERVRFARLFKDKGLYAASARFYGEAFAAQPALADDPRNSHRYSAACAAALAASGRGKDDPPPDENARARLRGDALRWLRDDLAASSQRSRDASPTAREALRKKLRQWRIDPELGGLRDAPSLTGLSEDERAACREIWAHVDALLLDMEFPADPFAR